MENKYYSLVYLENLHTKSSLLTQKSLFLLINEEYKKNNTNAKMLEQIVLIMVLGINQVTYSNRKFCQSVGRSFATSGTFR